jgi:hypothetical protein
LEAFLAMSPPPDIARNLEELCDLLTRLPPCRQSAGFVYPFEEFSVDDEWIELTGSVQGSENHSLEVAFGSRANAENAPIEFKSNGPDLIAVLDVLSHAITGKAGENPILIKLISDLKVAAVNAYKLAEVVSHLASIRLYIC